MPEATHPEPIDEPHVEPTPHLVLHDVLSDDDHARLLAFATGTAGFKPAHVTAPDGVLGSEDRTTRSAGVADASDVIELLETKLRALLPHARRETGVPHFRLGRLEHQLTSFGDGDFFTAHTDIGAAYSGAAGRRLSFVYYFHATPRKFDGGELRLFDRQVGPDGTVLPADSYLDVEPEDNSVLFFPSDALHEVRPVRVSGDPDPLATRYTITGWFHDAQVERAVPPLDPDQRTALMQRYTPSFTDTGFRKITTPPAVARRLRQLYDQRLELAAPEQIDDTYLPTGIPDRVPFDDVADHYLLALLQAHEDWAGCELEPTAGYGLRVYRQGQTLAHHTSLLETHVISSIVHVAHETNEPWPLTITDLDGVEHEIVLDEGEMLLYESARCAYARPTPLDGNSYCSLFLHYRPADWNLTMWTLLEQAMADGATELLPPQLHPQT